MAGARCRFPRRVKCSTVKLIESFKVIGIDNGEVSKRATSPPGKGWSVEGFTREEVLVSSSEEVEKSLDRGRERERGDQGERTAPVIFFSLNTDPPSPLPSSTTSDIVYSGGNGEGGVD